MRPDNPIKFTRRQPFNPHRIQIVGGQTYDIYHPNLVIVLRTRVVIGVDGENNIPDYVEHIALIHVVRIPDL